MGQQDIYDFLKANKGKWFTTVQIGDGLDMNKTTGIASLLHKLRRGGCAKCRDVHRLEYREWSYRGPDEVWNQEAKYMAYWRKW